MVNAQEWLDKNYRQEERSEIKQLIINSKNLEDSLDLTDFKNLEVLSCSDNKLTNLILFSPSKIFDISCYENYLNNLDFLLALDSNKLEEIIVTNNNLSPSDLTPFSRFVNLKNLALGNTNLKKGLFRQAYFSLYRGVKSDGKGKVNQGIYNRFYGSLEPLKNLIKLEGLEISGTDIDSGLEYLPENTGSGKNVIGSNRNFYCSVEERSDAKIKVIETELRKFDKPGNYGDFSSSLQKWRKVNKQRKLQDQLKFLEEEKQRLEEINQQLTERIPFLEKQIEELNYLIQEQKKKINQTYLHFFTEEEKDALKELIKAHRNYKKAQVKRERADKYFEDFYDIRKRLKTKLGEEFMEAVESILVDFEHLYLKEWDLEKQKTQKEENLSIKKSVEESLENISKGIENIKHDIANASTINYITYQANNGGFINAGNIVVEGEGNLITMGGSQESKQNNYQTQIEEITDQFQAQTLQSPPFPKP